MNTFQRTTVLAAFLGAMYSGAARAEPMEPINDGARQESIRDALRLPMYGATRAQSNKGGSLAELRSNPQNKRKVHNNDYFDVGEYYIHGTN